MSWMSKKLYQVIAALLYRGPKLGHSPIGTYAKAKNENFDYALIMVKMYFNEPKMNL